MQVVKNTFKHFKNHNEQCKFNPQATMCKALNVKKHLMNVLKLY